LARTQRHPKAVPLSREQRNPHLNDLHFLKSQAKPPFWSTRPVIDSLLDRRQIR
jgi:hypothetical protein